MSQTAVFARQLDKWQVLPRPQRVTELYFTDYRHLPGLAHARALQKIAFTIHNMERQTTTYRYKLIAMSADNGVEHQIGGGVTTVVSGGSQTINQTLTLPALGARIAVKVSLEYEGIALGADKPSLQTQSIHYWLKVVGNEDVRNGT